jgi:hypothetical protein
MPKPIRRRKDNDYIRFRPYHAFTTPAGQSREPGQKALWRIIWLIGVIVLLLAAAFIFSQNR